MQKEDWNGNYMMKQACAMQQVGCITVITNHTKNSYNRKVAEHNKKDMKYNWKAAEHIKKHMKHKRKNGVFWVVTSCGSCKNRRFGGTWRLLHQGDKNR
jgi:hypothetical protein